MASASSEHEAGEKPAKKPWSRPTFYVLTDIIQSSGSPTNPTSKFTGQGVEDESIPVTPTNGLTRFKSYRPTTA